MFHETTRTLIIFAYWGPDAPQPGEFLTLSRRKPVALLLPAALLPVGLRHPVADRLRGRFELPGKLGRISAGADQLDHLTAKLGCVWRTCLGHL
jgi:hypothetical protein